ncbi:immunity protein [Pseudomonas frederiksbergensis]|uniref:immunity protein n=1 Tax=Pseudomonas cucumis TaxID=2954082 RepID=UPI00218C1D0B|nr:immunity protein [Pseudomonas cucumis]URM28157.1 immunity protein [Pseudomonas frederiksbergensis]WLG91356.1 immunity protein [Pseudomonas cucumis]
MSPIEQIIKNESVEDVVSYFALFRSAQAVDRMYGRHRQEIILNGELVKTYNSLFSDGVLASDENGKTVKGPNWKPPQFITENKYS